MSASHDDVAAVASIAGIELKYKTFSNPVAIPPAPLQPDARSAPVASPVANIPVPPAAHMPRIRRTVFEDPAQRSPELQSKLGPWGAHLPQASMALGALSGGVGVTTIQATLGRILADRGFSPLLVERSRDGLLPHYFGATADGWGRSLFQPADPTRQAPLAVLSGGEGEGSIAEEDLWRMIDAHRGTSDCVLMKQWDGASGSSQTIWRSEAFQVVVLVPDPQTALRIRRGAVPLHDSSRTYFLLNKFDSSVPLHREMRAWLSGRLGDRLLAVTIRRSDAIADAMAEGTTVAEFSPSSPVTQDFGQLADWFQNVAAQERAMGAASDR